MLLVCAGDVSSKGLAVLTEVAVIRILSKGEYGYFTIFLTAMTLTSAVVSTGLNMKSVNIVAGRTSGARGGATSIFVVSLVIQLVLTVIIIALLVSCSDRISVWLFADPIYAESLVMGAICSLGFILVSAGRSYYQAQERFWRYAVTMNVRQALLLAGVILLVYSKLANLQSVEYVYIVAQLALGTGMVLLVFNWRTGLGPSDARDLKRLYRQGMALVWYYLLLSVMEQLGVVVLARYHPATTVADFGLAAKFYGMLLVAMGSIHAVLMPKLSSIKYQDARRQAVFLRAWVRRSVWSAIPILLVGVLAGPILPLLAGPGYDLSVHLFRILCAAFFVAVIFAPATEILIIRDQGRFLVVACVSTVAVTLIGLALCVPRYGAVGAAVWTALSHILLNSLLYCRASMRSARVAQTVVGG